MYVGSSANLSNRFKKYYSEAFLKKGNMAINKALLKHGYSNFKLEILEYTTAEKAIKIEQSYLDLLNELPASLSYNILTTAGSRLGYKVLDETKEKLRLANLGVNNPNFGKSHSQEIRDRISATLLQSENHPSRGKPGNITFKDKTHTSETKEKMRLAKLGAKNPNFGKSLDEAGRLKLSTIRGNAVEVYDIETKKISTYPSLVKAGEALSCSKTTISKYIESKEIFRGKYRLSKITHLNSCVLEWDMIVTVFKCILLIINKVIIKNIAILKTAKAKLLEIYIYCNYKWYSITMDFTINSYCLNWYKWVLVKLISTKFKGNDVKYNTHLIKKGLKITFRGWNFGIVYCQR